MAAAPSEYSLRVYRGGSHSSGQDVVTDATGSTILYGISAEFANPQALTTTLRLRKGTDGPILCTADAPPSQPMIVNFPTGWSTTLAKEGLLTKQAVFSGFGGEKYGWRRGGTAFVAMATECVDLKTQKVVARYRRGAYSPGADPAEFTLSVALAAQIDLFVVTALAIEDEERAAKGL